MKRVDLKRLTWQVPAWPDESPFWPCLTFVHQGQEIVAALFYDDSDTPDALALELNLLVRDRPAKSGPAGWILQILAVENPSPTDPKRPERVVDVLGPDRSIADVLEEARARILKEGKLLGLTYEESRQRLVW